MRHFQMWEQFPKVLMRPIYNVGVVARFEKKKTDACRNDCMSF